MYIPASFYLEAQGHLKSTTFQDTPLWSYLAKVAGKYTYFYLRERQEILCKIGNSLHRNRLVWAIKRLLLLHTKSKTVSTENILFQFVRGKKKRDFLLSAYKTVNWRLHSWAHCCPSKSFLDLSLPRSRSSPSIVDSNWARACLTNPWLPCQLSVSWLQPGWLLPKYCSSFCLSDENRMKNIFSSHTALFGWI